MFIKKNFQFKVNENGTSTNSGNLLIKPHNMDELLKSNEACKYCAQVRDYGEQRAYDAVVEQSTIM